MDKISNNSNKNDLINLLDVLKIIWGKKYFIASVTTVFAIFSVNYAVNLPNIYTSTSVLKPAGQSESSGSMLGSYSALAGLAGINLSDNSVSKPKEAIERIQSLDFFTNYIKPNINLHDLMAVSYWIPEENILIYDESQFDGIKNKWVRDVSFPLKQIPSNQEAHKIFIENLSIKENIDGFVTISISHQSPYIAKEWTDLVIKNINLSMLEADKLLSLKAIDFLNDRSKTIVLKELKSAVSQLLKAQMQTLMMASISENYAFEVISSAVASEIKSSPNRALICILGTMFGFILALISSLLFVFYQSKPKIF